MTSNLFNRRKLMTSLAAVMSAVGAGALMSSSAQAKSKDGGVRKLNRDGKPADGKQMITALITHDGLLYIAGHVPALGGGGRHPARLRRPGRQLERTGGQG